MKKIVLCIASGISCLSLFSQQKVEWVATTQQQQWVKQPGLVTVKTNANVDVEILVNKPLQTMEGFGACFNELGWTSLNSLGAANREAAMKELFAPGVGGNFTICRMPVGANDFARDWYSYNETEGDFEMKKFSIANDLETLVPFIKNAKKYNPGLKIWASPWSPPSWLKWNKHYACSRTWPTMDIRFQNGLDTTKQGKEGEDLFIQQPKYFKAYALYFSKFIEAYRKQGINIFAVMPQNEFNSCQLFPACTWTAKGLAKFIGTYLGPAMQQQNVQVMFGTMERPNIKLIDTVMNDPLAGKFIKGAGFQWAGKDAIAAAHQKYPALKLYQSEQECGDGKNDWEYCCYAFTLMKHYIGNGASAYMYWNLSLDKEGVSRWGWRQNSLISVDVKAKTFTYNFEYYLIKHVSHFVKPGARFLQTKGDGANLLAFINPDKSIVVVVQNEQDADKKITIKAGTKTITPILKGDSFNTFVIK